MPRKRNEGDNLGFEVVTEGFLARAIRAFESKLSREEWIAIERQLAADRDGDSEVEVENNATEKE